MLIQTSLQSSQDSTCATYATISGSIQSIKSSGGTLGASGLSLRYSCHRAIPMGQANGSWLAVWKLKDLHSPSVLDAVWRLADIRPVAPCAVLLGHQSILPPKEHFRGTIPAKLTTEQTADYGVFTREDIYACGYVAAASLAADNKPGREWPLEVAEMCSHNRIVGPPNAGATGLVVDGNWSPRDCAHGNLLIKISAQTGLQSEPLVR
jgi:hypothetical protein